MRLICLQRSFEPEGLFGQVASLVTEIKGLSPDAVLLPEMPVEPWLAASAVSSPEAAVESIASHDALIRLLAMQGGTWFLTRPVLSSAGLINQAGVVRDGRFEPVHSKQIFPLEDGWSEAAWFTPGTPRFEVVEYGGLRFGFAICTEMMWPRIARYYLQKEVDVLLCPRATGGMLDKWILAARMLSLVSGCYVISSNQDAVPQFNGGAFGIAPGARPLPPTTYDAPATLVEVDALAVRRARAEYPAYLDEPDLPF
jgi:predicted amidohydrolase